MGISVSADLTHRAVMSRLLALSGAPDARSRACIVANGATRLALAADLAISGKEDLAMGTVRAAAHAISAEAQRMARAVAAAEAALLEAGRPDLARRVMALLAEEG